MTYHAMFSLYIMTGLSPNGIGSAASGMAGGYHWEYADD